MSKRKTSRQWMICRNLLHDKIKKTYSDEKDFSIPIARFGSTPNRRTRTGTAGSIDCCRTAIRKYARFVGQRCIPAVPHSQHLYIHQTRHARRPNVAGAFWRQPIRNPIKSYFLCRGIWRTPHRAFRPLSHTKHLDVCTPRLRQRRDMASTVVV